ncbi:tetratricopeptide repeat protein [Chryseobacterium sp. SIMBA_029]|uniref:tetratricopeptide repeat protein n=2 Tax=Bacteria TaxID=2 RepID=UPI0039795888
MRYKFISFLSLFHFALSFSQNNKEISSIDSLWTIVNHKNAYAEKGSKEMLRLCTEMYYQSKNTGYDKGHLKSIVKLSEIYANEQNYSEALKKIPEGMELAEKIKDYISWSNLLMIQGNINTSLGYFQKGKISLEKALLIADKIPLNDKKHDNKSSIYCQLGINANRSDGIENNKIMHDSILFYFRKAYEESKKTSRAFPTRNKSIARYAINLGAEYFSQDNIPEAEKYLNEFPLLMKDEKNRSDFLPYYRLRGNIENKKKNYPKAIEYFNQGIAIYKEYKLLPSELAECYSGIAEAYDGSKDYKNQADYLEKAKRITDSISLSNKNTVEKVSSEPKEKEQPVYHFIIIAGVISAAVLACYFFFFQKKKTAEKETIAVDINEHNQITNHHYTEIIDFPETNNNLQDLNDIIELAKNNSHTFYLKFSEMFPAFNRKLLEITPQLTPSDLEYCALMKLNFDTKQIAVLKKASIGSVETRKSRIRKKLNISNSENIYTWLMKIQ